MAAAKCEVSPWQRPAQNFHLSCSQKDEQTPFLLFLFPRLFAVDHFRSYITSSLPNPAEERTIHYFSFVLCLRSDNV